MHDHTVGPMISKITESQMEHRRIDYCLNYVFGRKGNVFVFWEHSQGVANMWDLPCVIFHNTHAPPRAIQLCCSGYFRRHRAFQITLGYMVHCKFCEIMLIRYIQRPLAVKSKKNTIQDTLSNGIIKDKTNSKQN